MRYTQMPIGTYEKLQLNAGILLRSFNPSTGIYSRADIMGATTGGIEYSAAPALSDMGEDIDNCPDNTSELTKAEGWEVLIKGRYIDLREERIKWTVAEADFDELWWVGDYSDKNSASSGGYIAVRMKNALSTGGFTLEAEDDKRGESGFEYRAYCTAAAANEVPCEIYVKAGIASESGGGTGYTQLGSITTSGSTTGARWFEVNLPAGVYSYKLYVGGASTSTTATAIAVKSASSGADSSGASIITKTCAACNGGATFTGSFTISAAMPYLYMKYTPYTGTAYTAEFSIVTEE